MIQILILSVCILVAKSQITVLSPAEVSSKISDFTFSMGNFGYIPWGQNLAGPLFIPNKNDLYACNEIQSFKIEDFQYQQFPILLAERGGDCTFVQKAIHAQNAGAKAIIIFDNQYEQSEQIRLGDDGNGDKVYIPTVFISEDRGLELIRASQQLPSDIKTIMLKLTFALQKTQQVSVGFFLALPDDRGSIFVQEFYENIYSKLDLNKVDFYPIYQFYSQYNNGHNYETEKSDCLGGGKYCCVDPDGSAGTATGRQIATEQLRQICVHKSLGTEKWFKYISEFVDMVCLPQAYTTCGKKILANTNVFEPKDYNAVEKCISNSFTNQQNKNLGENSILEEQLYTIQNSGIISWPGIHINNITYSGKYSIYPVQDAICEAQLSPSKRCKNIMSVSAYTQNEEVDLSVNENSTWGILFIILLILFVIFAITLFFYKRYLRATLKKEIRGQANQVVANYVKFYQTGTQEN